MIFKFFYGGRGWKRVGVFYGVGIIFIKSKNIWYYIEKEVALGDVEMVFSEVSR